jgi:hypothetical protein
MKCPHNKKIDCPHIDTSTCTKDLDCRDCETYYSNNQGCLKSPLVLTILILVILLFSSCTKRLHGSYNDRIYSNAGYYSEYYHPYKPHSPRWYHKRVPHYHYYEIRHDKLPKHGKTH